MAVMSKVNESSLRVEVTSLINLPESHVSFECHKFNFHICINERNLISVRRIRC